MRRSAASRWKADSISHTTPLTLWRLALRHHGYRSENRYLVFQTLAHTVMLPAEQWRVLDAAHRKRNAVEYEGIVDIDEQLTAAIIRVAEEILRRLRSSG